MTSPTQLVRRLLPTLLALPLAAALVGCGAGTVTQSTSGRFSIEGKVHGGVQPVSGATVELFSVGTGGNGSQATDILQHPVVTDANSHFSISSDYTCASPQEQVYLAVRGGNPGLLGNVNNPALVLLSALGNCSDLIGNPSTFIFVNEVSTVAAVYALAPFMTAYDHVGASATNTVGLRNAFLDAGLLADTSNGQAAGLPANLAVEQGKLYALADAIVPCVNSNGNGCAFLFAAATPSGGSAPTDVVGALLNVVKHPGNNVSGVFDLIGPTPPYPGALTQAPHDWTMSLTVTGGGLYEPTALSVDAGGNVWAANFGGSAPGQVGNNPLGVVAYSPQGVPFNGTPFAANQNMTEIYGLTVDPSGNVWITSEENIQHNGTYGSIAKVAGANAGTPGAFMGMFYDQTLDFPEAISADPTDGNILVANYAGGTATIFNSNGSSVGDFGAMYADYPVGITSDGAGGLWMANEGYYTLTHVAADGTVKNARCCNEAISVSLDPDGNVWATNYIETNGAYTISEVSPSGAVLVKDQAVPGLNTPGHGTIDASGQYWVLNYHDGTFLGIAGNHAAVPPGTALSSLALGRDAGLIEPFSIASDPSGNLWVSNRAANDLVMFFGMATPTATPVLAQPQAP